MKRFYFIVGVLLVGAGLLVSLGTILMTINNPSKFTPLTNLACWLFAGLLPLAIGAFLWFKSGEMKWGKAMWFFMGFIISWFIWSTVYSIRSRPQDMTQKMPETVRSFYNKDSTWVKSAIARHVGRFCFFAASDGKASAWLKVHDAPFPFVIIDDNGTNRRAESITLVGNRGQSISVDIADDGGFSEYSVWTGDLFASNAVCVMDSDMDGQYDLRIGPGRRVDVNINSHWHQRISTNAQHFVDFNGVLKQIIRTNKVWELVE